MNKPAVTMRTAASVLMLALAVAAAFAARADHSLRHCQKTWCFGLDWEKAAAEDIAKVDVNMRGKDGEQPLHWAAAFSAKPEVVQALLKKGANPMGRSSAGSTPLHWVARFGKTPAIVGVLVEGGADINTPDELLGNTPLHWAAAQSRTPRIVVQLILSGADATRKNKREKTAYELAGLNSEMRGTEGYRALYDAENGIPLSVEEDEDKPPEVVDLNQ